MMHPLIRAAEQGDLNTAIAFLQIPPADNLSSTSLETDLKGVALGAAASGGHIDIVKAILKYCAKIIPVRFKVDAERYATNAGHIEIANLITHSLQADNQIFLPTPTFIPGFQNRVTENIPPENPSLENNTNLENNEKISPR